jgi:periplasmic copper chaperone A
VFGDSAMRESFKGVGDFVKWVARVHTQVTRFVVVMRAKAIVVTWLCRVLLVGLSSVVLVACKPSPDEKIPSLQVAQAHIKVMPPGQSRAAAYLVLRNNEHRDRQVLAVEADIAGSAEVHQHLHEDGMMKMRKVAHLMIPAKGEIVFAPGGYHVMLFDVAEPPAVGAQFSLTFELDGGERFTFPVDVLPL